MYAGRIFYPESPMKRRSPAFRPSGSIPRSGLVETKDYIILISGKNQAQAYDKRGLEGRSVREFAGFSAEKPACMCRLSCAEPQSG